MSQQKLCLIAGALVGTLTLNSHAQTAAPVKPTYEIPTGEAAAKKDDGPGGWLIREGVYLYPSVGLSFGHDDNLFLRSTNAKASNLFIFAPALKLQGRGRDSVLTLDASANNGTYGQSRNDDYTDVNISGLGEFVLSSRMGLKLGADYNDGHDPRGSNDRAVSTRPDVFRKTGVNGLFAFGGNDARGRAELDASNYRLRYTNNKETTAASDRDTTGVGARFFARFAEKSSFLLEAKQLKLDYRLDSSTQDSKEERYYAGVSWEATAATSGVFKIGQIRKDFSQPSTKDFSGTGWDVLVQWAPLSYSKVRFSTIKDFSESTGTGDFTLIKKYGAGWTHDWNPRFSTVAALGRTYDEYINGNRNDVTDAIGLKLNYKLRRWLTVGGEIAHTNRDSSSSDNNYRKNVYSFTLGATL